jgi:threonine/homoserine/homoserine lactone efflux protein
VVGVETFFVRLSFDRELGYAPSYLAGLLVHSLSLKAWLMVTAIFSSSVNDHIKLLYQTLFIVVLFFIILCVFHSIWFAAEGKIAQLISGKKEEKCLFFSSNTYIFKCNFISFSKLR